MKRPLIYLTLTSAIVLMAGCTSSGNRHSGLEALPEARLPTPEELTPESAERIAARYEKALAVAEEPALRLDIRWRLADLAMARSEAALVASDSAEPQFDEPIERYRALLNDYRSEAWTEAGIEPPAEPDHLYYQLAKAYALDGRMEEADRVLVELAEGFPASRYYAEAQFRRAERAFSEGEYASSEALYRELLPGVGLVPEFGHALHARLGPVQTGRLSGGTGELRRRAGSSSAPGGKRGSARSGLGRAGRRPVRSGQ